MNVNYLHLIRTVLYFWLTSEFIILSFLYNYGYDKLKKTPIIHALHRLFLLLGFLFFYLGIISILVFFDSDGFELALFALPVVLIPVGCLARKFRKRSLEKENKVTKLPDKKRGDD